MIPVLARQLLATAACLTDRLRHRSRRHDDTGNTLETVIIVLALVGLATLLGAALLKSVNTYIAKLN